MSDKRFIYSYGPTQTKQQVGQCRFRALLVHKFTTSKHEFIRLTMAWTWGKPSPPPLQYYLCLAMGPTPKCHFVPKLPSESLEIPKIGSPTTLEGHNFVCRLSIEVRFEANFEPLSKSFQRYVAHLHIRKLGQFPTFIG